MTDARPLYGIEADAFAATVLDGIEPFITPAQSLSVMQTIERIRASIR
jgi:predicted dehydrogenase